jgi:hypothetical protein
MEPETHSVAKRGPIKGPGLPPAAIILPWSTKDAAQLSIAISEEPLEDKEMDKHICLPKPVLTWKAVKMQVTVLQVSTGPADAAIPS